MRALGRVPFAKGLARLAPLDDFGCLEGFLLSSILTPRPSERIDIHHVPRCTCSILSWYNIVYLQGMSSSNENRNST